MARTTVAASEQTRANLVEAAERLFAEEGIGNVSVRRINVAAGVSSAATHYHFGSKEALLEGVIARLQTRVTRDTLEGLENLGLGGRTPHPDEFMWAIARPLLSIIEEEPERAIRWIRIMSRLPVDHESNEGYQLGTMLFEDGPLIDVVARMYPDQPLDLVRRFGRMATTCLYFSLSYTPVADIEATRIYGRQVVEYTALGLHGALSRTAGKVDPPWG